MSATTSTSTVRGRRFCLPSAAATRTRSTTPSIWPSPSRSRPASSRVPATGRDSPRTRPAAARVHAGASRCASGSPATRWPRFPARRSSGSSAPTGPVDVLAVESRLSTGLGRPDLYNWFTRLHQVIGQLHPDVVVLSFGADDAHNYLSGVPAGQTIGPLGSPSWDAEYRRRVDGVTRELNAAGIYVVWLGTPIPRGSGFHHSFQIVNRVIRSVVAAHPKTSAYVDEWSLLSDSHHGYSDYLPNAAGQPRADASARRRPSRAARRRSDRAGRPRAPPTRVRSHRERGEPQLDVGSPRCESSSSVAPATSRSPSHACSPSRVST